MTEKFSLKDHLFNEMKVEYLSRLLFQAYPDFDHDGFKREVMKSLLKLELKDRIRWIAEVLGKYLPSDYNEAVSIIIKSLPPPLDLNKTDDDFGDFIFAPFGEYVAKNGCTKERLYLSLQVLKELTTRFSMEDAIRYFLNSFPRETLSVMCKWVGDDNYHVRRLVSEGTRPLLPWSGRINLSTRDTLLLLDQLYFDKTRYVTRSVANHLNDIAKKEPDVVIKTLQSWKKTNKAKPAELAWLTKHALRTVVKNGNKEALAFIGYTVTDIKVKSFLVSPSAVRVGERVMFEAIIETMPDTKLLIDYKIHFVKKDGSTSAKVFKWKIITLGRSGEETITKVHPLKANATTFTINSGDHKVEIQINGQVLASTKFKVIEN